MLNIHSVSLAELLVCLRLEEWGDRKEAMETRTGGGVVKKCKEKEGARQVCGLGVADARSKL